MLPHLDAAYNLARWLLRSPADADDVVQESCVRALRYLEGFRGGDSRAWLLKIVRNTSYTWLKRNRPATEADEFDETVHSVDEREENVESRMVAASEKEQLLQALERLPPAMREILVLREIEELSYKEIAEVTGAPMGTVMSGLSRARQKLRENLGAAAGKEA